MLWRNCEEMRLLYSVLRRISFSFYTTLYILRRCYTINHDIVISYAILYINTYLSVDRLTRNVPTGLVSILGPHCPLTTLPLSGSTPETPEGLVCAPPPNCSRSKWPRLTSFSCPSPFLLLHFFFFSLSLISLSAPLLA